MGIASKVLAVAAALGLAAAPPPVVLDLAPRGSVAQIRRASTPRPKAGARRRRCSFCGTGGHSRTVRHGRRR